MTKARFLSELRKSLSHLPKSEIEERVAFYREMIDDRIEDGISEEEAVDEIRSEENGTRIGEKQKGEASEHPVPVVKRKKANTLLIIFAALGSPIWVSLLIATLAVAFSLTAAMWAVVISAWAVFITFSAVAVVGICAGVINLTQNVGTGIATVSLSLASAGFAILTFFGALYLTKLCIFITARFVRITFRCFGIRKGAR